MDIHQLTSELAYIRETLTSNKKVLSFREAASYLGFSKSYLYKLTSSGIVPHSKPSGKKLYFDKERLDQWLLSNTTTSQEEKEKQAATYIASKRV